MGDFQVSEYTDAKRLDDIVKALVHGDEAVTPESVRKQFYYETHREPPLRAAKTRRPDLKDELDLFA